MGVRNCKILLIRIVSSNFLFEEFEIVIKCASYFDSLVSFLENLTW